VGRGGLQFVLIIWLQGIWLPLHGYSFESTPLWAGIYMLPMTVGFLMAGPLAGSLSDRHGARPFTVGGMVVMAASFVALVMIPVDFNYWLFAGLIFLNGLGGGVFTAPNTAAIMPSRPARRGVRCSGHLLQCRLVVVDRNLLLAHGRRPGPYAPVADEPRPATAGCPVRGG
jgi:MFS family permease